MGSDGEFNGFNGQASCSARTDGRTDGHWTLDSVFSPFYRSLLPIGATAQIRGVIVPATSNFAKSMKLICIEEKPVFFDGHRFKNPES